VAGKSALKDAVSVKESIRTCTITKLAGGAMGLGIQGSTNAKQSDQVSVHVSQVRTGRQPGRHACMDRQTHIQTPCMHIRCPAKGGGG